MASGTDLQNESTGARRLSDTRQAIPTLGTELQSKQAPQKLRAWGDGGKKLSLPLPPTTGHGLDPWGPHRAIHNKTEGSPPYKPGPLQRQQGGGEGPVPLHLTKFRGATGLQGRLVS